MRSAGCMLLIVAAIGCSHSKPAVSATARAGGAGGQHVSQFGDDCQPTEDAGSGTSECHGGVVDNENECHARFELVKCYVAELADGAPKCLPASDPQVLGLIHDDVWLYGFVPQTVVREDQHRVLPDGCEAAIACCAGLPDRSMSGQRACFDAIERGSGCGFLDPRFGCEAHADTDAGSDVPGQHGLCCYLACGYEHDS